MEEYGRVTSAGPGPSRPTWWVLKYQTWVVGLALVVLVTAVVFLWPARRAVTGGLSTAPPSPLQLAAMAGWYQKQGASEFAGSPEGFGCAVYPLATRRSTGGRSTAYTRVFCEQCPPGRRAGLTAVVFQLDGAVVESAQAAGAEEIMKYFPRQLWASAKDGQIPATELELLEAAAYQSAGCTK